MYYIHFLLTMGAIVVVYLQSLQPSNYLSPLSGYFHG